MNDDDRRPPENPPSHPAVERIYHAWDDALGRKDADAALALYAPDAILGSPIGAPHRRRGVRHSPRARRAPSFHRAGDEPDAAGPPAPSHRLFHRWRAADADHGRLTGCFVGRTARMWRSRCDASATTSRSSSPAAASAASPPRSAWRARASACSSSSRRAVRRDRRRHPARAQRLARARRARRGRAGEEAGGVHRAPADDGRRERREGDRHSARQALSRKRFGNPYAVTHRADIHGSLLDGCRARGDLIELRTDSRVTGFEIESQRRVRRARRRNAGDRARRWSAPTAGARSSATGDRRRRRAARLGPHVLPRGARRRGDARRICAGPRRRCGRGTTRTSSTTRCAAGSSSTWSRRSFGKTRAAGTTRRRRQKKCCRCSPRTARSR